MGCHILLFALWVASSPGGQDDDSRIDAKTKYISKRHNLTFSIPNAEWGRLRVQDKKSWGWPGGLAEGMGKDGNMGLGLGVQSIDVEISKYAVSSAASYRKLGGTKTFKKLSEKKLEGRKGEWIRVDYEWAYKKLNFRYVMIFHRDAKKIYRFCVWLTSSMWGERGAEVNKIAASFKNIGSESSPKDKDKKPERKKVGRHLWPGCAKGSFAKFDVVREVSGQKTKTHLEYTLVESTESSFTLRAVMEVPGGAKTSALQHYVVEKGMVDSDGKELAKGEEDLEVAGKKLKCAWIEKEKTVGDKKTVTKYWTSDQVPGGIVKTVTKTQQGTTVMALTAFEKK